MKIFFFYFLLNQVYVVSAPLKINIIVLSFHVTVKAKLKATEDYQGHAVGDKGELLCSQFENKFDATLKLTTIKEGKIKLIMLNANI